MASLNNVEIQDDSWSLENDKQAIQQIKQILSRGAFAPNGLSITATGTLDNRYSLFYFDTTGGAITATLQQANYWGTNKSPILWLTNVAGTSNVTITASGSDTINGATTAVLGPGSTFCLFSDGLTKWIIWGAGVSAIDTVPRVTQDTQYAPWAAGTITAANMWNSLKLINTFNTTSAVLQTAVNYSGTGVLQQVILAEKTSGLATAYGGLVKITIDNVVIFNAALLGQRSEIQAVIAGSSNEDAANALSVSDHVPGIPFNSSCKIEIQSDGATRLDVAWKIAKRT